MGDKKGKVVMGDLQIIPNFDPERDLLRMRDDLKVKRAYDPEGKKLNMLSPEERNPGGVDYDNTASGAITIQDVPEGAGKEEILRAIRERRASRQRYRDRQPKNTTALGSNRTFRRDI